MATQGNRLIEIILLSTQNIVKIDGYKNIYNFNAEKFCLSKPMRFPLLSEIQQAPKYQPLHLVSLDLAFLLVLHHHMFR